ncbi:benABC operon transcriptional activator BenR [Stutzerimonas stutzeri DSM 10701]|uniref:helix-turn-helix transcriptional regulator n=1 Tax=Stutzerimonas nitrititolerans TaxID=2482751 RepID=UPI00026D6D63|nr:AraC family transcriptional regulator [Stutzerimonas nitrititolerans]AFN77840.1 benABC operon transcriptional activator BenR [Stutzerimonas stutzeri DSM 10701]NNT95729.1 AraC family transcriptional regulator [Stutzerimonas nitrititolerans]SUD84621.1 benABC operon transcriptional activator BenR [Stutzerimonas stutzeri]
MDSLLNPGSRIFERADPRAVSEYVNQHVGTHCIQLPRTGHPQASLSHRKFGKLDLCRLSYGGSVHVTSPALETIYHLQLLQRGHCLWRGRGEEHYFVPGELLLINPDDPVDLTYSDDCEKLIIKLPASFLEQACVDNQWSAPKEGIRFFDHRYELTKLDGIDSLLGLICQEAQAEQCIPQLQDQYSRIIASKLLCTLANNIRRETLSESCPSFGRITDYIDEHLKKDISVEQLAELAHMSPRSLYVLFERKVGTTPKSYIRQRKLEQIHGRLSDPSAKVRNITEIAMDYGFMHLGRFSESYKSTFGELPSDTLRRHH